MAFFKKILGNIWETLGEHLGNILRSLKDSSWLRETDLAMFDRMPS